MIRTEEELKAELKRINKMSRVANGEQPLNGIEHCLLWALGTKGVDMTPSEYVKPPYTTIRGSIFTVVDGHCEAVTEGVKK